MIDNGIYYFEDGSESVSEVLFRKNMGTQPSNGLGSFERPLVKFYFTSSCPELGLEKPKFKEDYHLLSTFQGSCGDPFGKSCLVKVQLNPSSRDGELNQNSVTIHHI